MRYTLLTFLFTLVLGLSVASAQVSRPAAMKIYPNPATEYISVTETPGDNTGYISVFSLMGRNLREFEYAKDERYYIGDLPKGIYLVHLQDKNHKTIATQKLEKR